MKQRQACQRLFGELYGICQCPIGRRAEIQGYQNMLHRHTYVFQAVRCPPWVSQLMLLSKGGARSLGSGAESPGARRWCGHEHGQTCTPWHPDLTNCPIM